MLSISIILTILACVVTAYTYQIPSHKFLEYVQFKPLLYIIAMNVIVMLVESQNVFQVVAIKAIHMTKSNPRSLFYLLCTLAMLLSATLEDVSVALIFIPLIIRACKILKIRPEPFIYCIAINLNIGDMMAPFSNSQNILLSDAFILDMPWFASYIVPYIFFATIASIILIDFTMLKKEEPPTESQKKLLNDLMDTKLLVENRKLFNLNVYIFIGIIICLILIPYSYIVAMVGAMILCLVNHQTFAEMMKKNDWKVIGFFIVLFLIVGCMIINGSIAWIGGIVAKITTDHVFVAAVVILIATSIITSFLSPNPTTLLFIPILQSVFVISPALGMNSGPILAAFIIGLNVGGNFLPEGAPAYLVTLSITEEQRISTVNYKTMTRIGAKYSVVHILLAILYLLIVCAIMGVL